LIRDAEGIITGFRTVSRDITQRKETEKELAEHRTRLEAIFGSVKDGIVTVDPELRIIEANKSTEDICGIAVKEIAGKTFSQCLNHCSKSCSEVLRQTLEKKMTTKEYRVECGHHERHQQTVSVSSSPLLDPEGKFMGVVPVIRDITLLRDLERELRERHQFQNIIGRSKKMQDTYRLLEDLANLETTVLITGESGTGKELVARALHYSGQRAFKPFVTVSCSALAESLLESELFGHVRGAFTGAIRDKQGRFQAANGGTILLDEIGDISPLIQLKLLRVLQEKEIERVGESTPQKVDVRVIASTNKDLKEKVRRGEFRQDLYYRLKVVEVSLPPLRERLEDLPLLVDHFCHSFNERFKKNIEGISNEVLGKFMDYPWLGNVRELEHVMEHAFVICHGGAITLEHLPSEISNYERNDGSERSVRIPVQESHTQGSNGAKEILDALNKAHWNKTKAARLLGISRRTIYRKICLYQICGE
jgi:PAS domain S-box-containing protein